MYIQFVHTDLNGYFEVDWSSLKSKRLKKIRGVSFEEIIKGKLVTIFKHPTKDNQRILVYNYREYLWAVPSVIEGDKIFLKTIYPSRKLTKIYKKEL